MKKTVQRGGKKSGGTKISMQKKPPGYWKNPENREQALNAIRAYLSRKPNATVDEIVRAFGYSWTHMSQTMLRSAGLRLGDLGKVQEKEKHGGFRRWKTPQERRALYKRMMQEIIENPFLEHRELGQKMGMSRGATKATIRRMEDGDHMPLHFALSRRLMALYRLDPKKMLSAEKAASKLGTWPNRVHHLRGVLQEIHVFASTHKKPVEWVINRYGTLVEAGMLKKPNMAW